MSYVCHRYLSLSKAAAKFANFEALCHSAVVGFGISIENVGLSIKCWFVN